MTYLIGDNDSEQMRHNRIIKLDVAMLRCRLGEALMRTKGSFTQRQKRGVFALGKLIL